MGKAALLAVLALGVVGTVYSLSDGQARLATASRVADYQHEVLARNAALAGLELAKQSLADDFMQPPSGLNGVFDGVPYQVSITKLNNRATVGSVGTAESASGRELTFNVRGAFELNMEWPGGIATEPPLFMQYALMAEDYLLLQGNVDVTIGARGDAANRLNANVHSNTRLRAQGSVFIEGFGTSVGNVERIGQAKFDPYNPTGLPATQSNVAPVPMPHVDAMQIVGSVAGLTCYYTPDACPNVRIDYGNVTISQQSQLAGLTGTREEPYIWVVQGGRLDITSDVQIPGYVIFVAEEGFRITGQVSVGESGWEGSDESSVAFYTPGHAEISLSGNGLLYAQIYAQDHVTLSGTVNLHGSVATGKTVNISGDAEIHFRSASPALTRAWQESTTWIEMTSYNEW